MSKIILKFDFTRTIPQQLESLIDAIHSLSSNIEELVLANCGLFCLKDEQLMRIAQAIPDNIKRLSIANNHLGQRLYYFLQYAPASINFLDISHNQLIQLSADDYYEIMTKLPVKKLKLHHQDFRSFSPFFNRNLQQLYLTEVHDLKKHCLRRQKFVANLNHPIKEIHLDDWLWIPDADELTSIQTDANNLILSFIHLDIAEVLEVVNYIPTQVTRLVLDLSQELWMMVHEMGYREKVEYFLRFPAHLQSITCNDHPVFRRVDLLSMKSMFQEKKTVSEILTMSEHLSLSSYR